MASLNTNAYDEKYSGDPVATGASMGSPNYKDNSHIPYHHRHQQDQPGVHRAWSSGLCGCFADIPNSCCTSGALYGLITWFTGCCGCIYSCSYRSKMRRQYNLEETPCGDCLVHFCCEKCALCQEYRELKSRGFDMTLGWQGNMQRKNRGGVVTTAPMMEEGMKREYWV